MEPTKIETQIQSEFQNRTIQPSAAAWDRLDAMLTVAEKPKKSFAWLQVAAGFAGFVLLAIALFYQSKPLLDQQNNQTVVTIDTMSSSKKTEINVLNNNEKKAIKTAETIIANSDSKQNLLKNKTIAEKKIIIQKTPINKEQPIVTNNQIIPKTIDQSALENNNSKMNKQVAQIQLQQPKYINPAALLADIENKSTIQKTEVILPNQTYKINAKALLSQVDGELETSFRERVIKKINNAYQTTKVAVSERNNAR